MHIRSGPWWLFISAIVRYVPTFYKEKQKLKQKTIVGKIPSHDGPLTDED